MIFLFVITGVKKLLDKCVIVAGDDEFSRKANKNATLLFQCLVRSTLCTKLVSENLRLSSEAFEWLIDEIENRFKQAQVSIIENYNKILLLLLIILTHNNNHS